MPDKINKELKTIIISSIILGIVFGFDDKLPFFNILSFILNLVKFMILSFIALIIHKQVLNFFANKAGATVELTLWKIKRLWFTPNAKSKFSIPLGIIIPLLVSFLSLGQIFFAATTSTEIKVKPAYRIGRKYISLTEFEHAKIAASAPLIHILIALVLSPINHTLIQDFALINTMLAIFLMIPLPGLLGNTILFGSKPLFLFSAVFILIIAILLKTLSPTLALILALLIALLATVYHLYRVNK